MPIWTSSWSSQCHRLCKETLKKKKIEKKRNIESYQCSCTFMLYHCEKTYLYSTSRGEVTTAMDARSVLHILCMA